MLRLGPLETSNRPVLSHPTSNVYAGPVGPLFSIQALSSPFAATTMSPAPSSPSAWVGQPNWYPGFFPSCPPLIDSPDSSQSAPCKWKAGQVCVAHGSPWLSIFPGNIQSLDQGVWGSIWAGPAPSVLLPLSSLLCLLAFLQTHRTCAHLVSPRQREQICLK